jgi:DNA polymerase elongation subunit (family B)
MKKYSGWLFDLYAHPTKGIVLWLVGEDGSSHSFYQDFDMRFYARGDFQRLHELGVFIRRKYSKEVVRLERVTRDDLFDGPQVVMGIGTSHPDVFRKLSREAQENFTDLIFYDVDVPLTVRYAAAQQVFMMARCEITAAEDDKLISIRALDAPDDLDPQLPQLKILSLRPDTNPAHTAPKYLVAKFGKSFVRLPFKRPRELLTILNSILASFDPDVVHTHYGDGWLFPRFLELSKETGIPFNPNRDASMPVVRRKEVTFFNYGHAHYRAPQVHLRGRWHVDVQNCMTYNQYQLLGAIEQTRFSSLPLQEVARRSPGAAISAMQVLTALKNGTLIPYQRQKGEISKNFNQLFRAARGGLVFQPTPGIFQNVAVLDFSSKMASIMIKYNVSPETVMDIQQAGEGFEIPELGVKILSRPGLVPQALKPMRDKRLALKQWLKSLDKNDPRYQSSRQRYRMLAALTNKKAVSDSLKWLTVVCYGRLGFANSIFGRINSHEVVSYLSRKMITKAKLIAERLGFTVHHLYVDSLFVSRPNATREDFQALVTTIEQETQLPMELENVYAWFAFLSSRMNPNLSVANRFYGVAANEEHKIRGVASRRGDTCSFIANIQKKVIQILAREKDATRLVDLLPEVLVFVQDQLAALKNGTVVLEELVINQTLSRELNHYSVLSPLAVAAHQLRAQGRLVRMGMPIRYIYVSRGPGVHAWDLPKLPNIKEVDRVKYRELILRAVQEVLQPLGITDAILKNWILGRAGYLAQPGFLKTTDATRLAVPLFADQKYLRLHT